MKTLFDLKTEHRAALDKADAVLNQAEGGKRALTAQEQTLFDAHVAEAKDLGTKIRAIDEKNTLVRAFGEGGPAEFFRSGRGAEPPSDGIARGRGVTTLRETMQNASPANLEEIKSFARYLGGR